MKCVQSKFTQDLNTSWLLQFWRWRSCFKGKAETTEKRLTALYFRGRCHTCVCVCVHAHSIVHCWKPKMRTRWTMQSLRYQTLQPCIGEHHNTSRIPVLWSYHYWEYRESEYPSLSSGLFYIEWDLQVKGVFEVLHPSNWLLLDNPSFSNSLLMIGINDSVKQSIPKVFSYCKMIPTLILTECAHGKLTSD